MTHTRIAAGVAVIAALAVAVGAYFYLRPAADRLAFQGWVEAYLIFVSPDEAGRVETLSVREGDAVETGAALFTLDADLQRAAVAENEAVGHQRAANLRPRARTAEEERRFAEGVRRRGSGAAHGRGAAELDQDPSGAPARQFSRNRHDPGGVLPRRASRCRPGRPIVSLLPPDNVRVRFFVPQAMLPTVHIGDRVAVRCDGCASDLVARVSFISAQAEFTPPVIYSQEERARLVFRVEATPERPADLRIGQPVSVALQGAAGVSHARK